MSVSLRLRQIRTARKYRQAAFARILGVTTATYCKYEHNIIPITAEQLSRLAQAIDVPIEEFYERDLGGPAPNGHGDLHA